MILFINFKSNKIITHALKIRTEIKFLLSCYRRIYADVLYKHHITPYNILYKVLHIITVRGDYLRASEGGKYKM